MSDYLDVAVVRIQSWLSRVPDLRGRRGASAMIRRATEPVAIDSLLTGWQDHAERCTEAGHVDGVVPLLLHAEDEETQRRVERLVVGHLREWLPGASLRSTLRRGEDWLAAHDGAPACWERDWPAAVSEWPLGKECDWCQTWPANGHRWTGAQENPKREELCPDCLLRYEHGKPRGDQKEPAPGTERELLERWEKQYNTAARVPNKFPDLVEEFGERGDNTHLATVYADGDAISRFGKELHKQRSRGRGDEFDMAKAIDEATWTALLKGIEAVKDPETETLPIVAHLVGGDDVLVSLPAHRAWLFALQMQRKFYESLRESLKTAGLGTIKAPTQSVGMVFHHHSSPLATASDLAEELLKETKREHRSSSASLAWQDITHDGPHPVGRGGITPETLERCWGDLTKLSRLGGSALANLAKLARSNDQQRLRQQAERLGREELVARFSSETIRLADAVGMVRWWKEWS
ncbi:hypothetical protein CDG81_03925 [Actinopolyspora erythraea]|uniref:Cas10/Cmr2 second palm domain-containing protein n=1 Tax=Actinopolyspora erythraea TaxID=414996 RepID=A0A099D2I5_9ACTN|nr:hypothetical protein [Actinopolyspora erythraea]ASU77599.1 hypothetical protein CDG81_03925 [Actinopolyspora erythraea]KGI80403.1 hypothetical protein IL38_17030 [Actinopolyspora erythraea]